MSDSAILALNRTFFAVHLAVGAVAAPGRSACLLPGVEPTLGVLSCP